MRQKKSRCFSHARIQEHFDWTVCVAVVGCAHSACHEEIDDIVRFSLTHRATPRLRERASNCFGSITFPLSDLTSSLLGLGGSRKTAQLNAGTAKLYATTALETLDTLDFHYAPLPS